MQIILLCGLAVLLLAVPFAPLLAAVLKDKISTSLSLYGDNTDTQVLQPSVAYLKTFGNHFALTVKGTVDAVSAASIRDGGRPGNADAVTSASARSGFNDIRYSPLVTGIYDDGDNAASLGGYYSTEKDYIGRSLFGNYTRQFNKQNTAVGISFAEGRDDWSPLFDRQLAHLNRDQSKVDLSLSQLLTTGSSLQLVVSHFDEKGLLGSPYLYVGLANQVTVFERLPGRRRGYAVSLQGVHLLNERNSLHWKIRQYTDSWGIDAGNLELEWFRDVGDTLVASLRTRFYTQDAARFTKPLATISPADQLIAVDYRSSAFTSQLVGVGLIYRPEEGSFAGIDADQLKWTFSFDYYQTSSNERIQAWYQQNRLQAFFTTMGLEIELD